MLAAGFPQPLGPYLLLEPFGQGGMGDVFLAKTAEGDSSARLVILKTLRAELMQTEEFVARFNDEARVALRLRHPNICHVFDGGRVDDRYYLAMEFIEGIDLRELGRLASKAGRPIPEAVALHVTCGLLAGLDAAHRAVEQHTGRALNVVHRDVSPHNVMVSGYGEVKLIDFGLAHSTLKQARTQSQKVVGKIAYMSPEQASGQGVSPASDQFAAAVVLYELLIGDRFYGDMTTQAIWEIVGIGGFVPRRWPELDPRMAAILGRALQADPRHRHASCAVMRDALMSELSRRQLGDPRRMTQALVESLAQPELAHARALRQRFASLTAEDVQRATASSRGRAMSLAAELPQPPVPVVVEPPRPAMTVQASTLAARHSEPLPMLEPMSDEHPAPPPPRRRFMAMTGAFLGGMVGSLVAIGSLVMVLRNGACEPSEDPAVRPSTRAPAPDR